MHHALKWNTLKSFLCCYINSNCLIKSSDESGLTLLCICLKWANASTQTWRPPVKLCHYYRDFFVLFFLHQKSPGCWFWQTQTDSDQEDSNDEKRVLWLLSHRETGETKCGVQNPLQFFFMICYQRQCLKCIWNWTSVSMGGFWWNLLGNIRCFASSWLIRLMTDVMLKWIVPLNFPKCLFQRTKN